MSTLSANSVKFVSFDEIALNAYEGELAQVRGFAYQTPQGMWILSEDPQLKSCCAGAPAKAGRQIFLAGEFTSLPKAQAIALKGTLTHREGQHYLQNASTVSDAASLWSTFFLALGILFAIAAYKTFKPKAP
jgi:hypothetical protein